MEHVVVIGGGIGGALAHDLTLRGFRVTVLEKGPLLSGATGRHHGLLHSGARYVLHDPAAALECRRENRILRRLAPQALEQNGGLFVALTERDLAFLEPFLDGCADAGIPTRVLDGRQALALEPNLNPDVKAAVAVPDASMDAWRLPMHFFATARANGADIRPFTEVLDIQVRNRHAVGVTAVDHRTGKNTVLAADWVVNAAGPWGGKIAAMVGVRIPVRPAPGVMVSLNRRLVNRVINRLHPAGDGDIIVPQRNLSVLGTTAWLAEDPDRVQVPEAHTARIRDRGARMVPASAALSPQAVWCASRPLIVQDDTQDAAKISRTFVCIDHGDTDGVHGFVSLLGGKATTMRAMAESVGDLICARTGRSAVCRTRDTPLLPYRRFFSQLPATGEKAVR